MASTDIFETKYLNDYMQMVEDTESPRVFHIWSALWAASVSLGRRCWLPWGIADVLPNQYILLVGSPASRKSTALNISRKLLKEATGTRFAPADTGGQRQGLVMAIQGTEEEQAKEFLGAVEFGPKSSGLMSLSDLEEITNVPEDETLLEQALADKHHLTVAATEFSRFIGQNNLSMMDFLVERYDGEDYEYKTRQSSITLDKTLLNLLACTTPTMLNNSLPPAAGGQGFLSRMILVYGAQKYKSVATPTAPPADTVMRVKDVLSDIYHYAHGAFHEPQDAIAYREGLYEQPSSITDSRFAYYNERRYSHLIKLAMALAGTRVSATKDALEVVKSDYEEANRILKATEAGMPDALGEFGMNPFAVLKQEILEQMRASQGPMNMEQVVSMFHRDATSREISEVINDLIRVGQVKLNQLKSGQQILSAVYSKQDTEDEMSRLLTEKS